MKTKKNFTGTKKLFGNFQRDNDTWRTKMARLKVT